MPIFQELNSFDEESSLLQRPAPATTAQPSSRSFAKFALAVIATLSVLFVVSVIRNRATPVAQTALWKTIPVFDHPKGVLCKIIGNGFQEGDVWYSEAKNYYATLQSESTYWLGGGWISVYNAADKSLAYKFHYDIDRNYGGPLGSVGRYTSVGRGFWLMPNIPDLSFFLILQNDGSFGVYNKAQNRIDTVWGAGKGTQQNPPRNIGVTEAHNCCVDILNDDYSHHDDEGLYRPELKVHYPSPAPTAAPSAPSPAPTHEPSAVPSPFPTVLPTFSPTQATTLIKKVDPSTQKSNEVSLSNNQNRMISLGGINTQCSSGPLGGFRFQNSGGTGGKGWFNYYCTSINSGILIASTSQPNSSPQAGNELIYLDRQEASCNTNNNEYITALNVKSDGSNIWFQLTCTTYADATYNMASECQATDSGYQDAGNALIYLDRANVQCNAGYGLVAFKGYSRNGNQYRITGSCCPGSILAPPPTAAPTVVPTIAPMAKPSVLPTAFPSLVPISSPTVAPVSKPTTAPSPAPVSDPTVAPISVPTEIPTFTPISDPTTAPSPVPITSPTLAPFMTNVPISDPTVAPSPSPISEPTVAPSSEPIAEPTVSPISDPTTAPSPVPVSDPTVSPVSNPTTAPSPVPIASPTASPIATPTVLPSPSPVADPTAFPISDPTASPVTNPTESPIAVQSDSPVTDPTAAPTVAPFHALLDISPIPIATPGNTCAFTFTKGVTDEVPSGCVLIADKDINFLKPGQLSNAAYACGSSVQLNDVTLTNYALISKISTIVPGPSTEVTFYSEDNLAGIAETFTPKFHQALTHFHFHGGVTGNDGVSSLALSSTLQSPLPKACQDFKRLKIMKF